MTNQADPDRDLSSAVSLGTAREPPQAQADLSERLKLHADAYDREALALDNEYPEPDAFCSAAGGDGARATAALLREAASALAASQARLHRLEQAICPSGQLNGDAIVGLAKCHRQDSELLDGLDAEDGVTMIRETIGALRWRAEQADQQRRSAEERIEPLIAFAEEASLACKKALDVLERHDYVFRRFPRDMVKEPPVGDGERWEALAFSFYSQLAELTSHAEVALNDSEAAAEAGRAPLRALVEQWRSEVKELRALQCNSGNEVVERYRLSRAIGVCADQLEAVLQGSRPPLELQEKKDREGLLGSTDTGGS